MLRPREDDRLVFASSEGGELEYCNWRVRRWNKLLEATRPDAQHPKRVALTGTLPRYHALEQLRDFARNR